MKKTTYKMKKPLQALAIKDQRALKIILWISSGFSEVRKYVWLTTYSRGLSIQQTWCQSSTLTFSRVLTGAVHSMDTTISEVPTMEGHLLSVMVQKVHKHTVSLQLAAW